MNSRKIDLNLTKKAPASSSLEEALSKLFPELKPSFLESSIKEGRVLVNGKIASRGTKRIKRGSIIEILPKVKTSQKESQEELKAQNLDSIILYEDDSIIVINKPASIVVHPGAGHKGDTLVDLLLKERPELKEAVFDPRNPLSLMRPGLVHRLDKETSGVMIIAKNQYVLKKMAREIEKREVKKLYLALLFGELKEPVLIKKPLKRQPTNRFKMAVHPLGKEAISYFAPKKFYDFLETKLTLSETEPYTGRTHQIRVHALFLNHPVIGDPLYFNPRSLRISKLLGVKRQMLHAQKLFFTHPITNKKVEFAAPLPKDFQETLKKLKEIKTHEEL